MRVCAASSSVSGSRSCQTFCWQHGFTACTHTQHGLQQTNSHPDTLTSINSLDTLQQAQGKLQQAEILDAPRTTLDGGLRQRAKPTECEDLPVKLQVLLPSGERIMCTFASSDTPHDVINFVCPASTDPRCFCLYSMYPRLQLHKSTPLNKLDIAGAVVMVDYP